MGDLISRDNSSDATLTVVDDILREIEIEETLSEDKPNIMWAIGYKQGLQTVRRIVERHKTERTGHWSHDGSNWKNRFICSECGYKLFEEQTNYCPNCGSAMKGE